MARHSHPSFTLTQLFSETFAMFRASKRIVLPAILTFALMSAVIAGFLQQSVSRIEDRIAAEHHLSWQDLHDRVQTRLAAFTPIDAEHFVRALRGEKSAVTDDLAFAFILSVGPLVALAFLLHVFVFFLASMFFLSLAVGPLKSGFDLARQLPLFTLRMLAFLFWFAVRSLLWIPFIGPLLGLYLVPRLLPAPFLYAGGHAKFVRSFQMSMSMTKHRWFKIVLSLFCLFLFTIALLWFGIVLVAVLSLFSAKLGYILWLLLLLSALALQIFFLSSLVRALQ